MKKLFTLISMIILFTACGQNNRKKTKMKKSFDKIASAYKEVKHYDKEPKYYIESYQSGCYYEIYVNDFIVFKHYKNVGLANHAVCINSKILKSGPQKVTIKLYPLGKVDNKNFTTIDPSDSFRLKIFMRDQKKSYRSFKYEFLKEYHANIETSVPYFEETIVFNAEVPYKIEGWSNSQNLKEMDQELLEREVLAYYNDFAKVISEKNIEKWQNLILKREKEVAKSNFFKQEDSERISESLKSSLDSEYLEVLPIDNYNMIIYGDNHMVKLESKKFRKKSALITIEEKKYNGKPRKAYVFHGLTLHKPKGSNTLEIIR